MSLGRSLLLTLVLSVLGAAVGAWGGSQFVLHRTHQTTPLHELLHEKLHLDANQHARIETMERTHAANRKALEAEMKAANADLARALQEHHGYTPEVQAAIDRFHRAMGAEQRETILHVLAMRSVLTPEQAVRFDETVVQSLTAEPM